MTSTRHGRRRVRLASLLAGLALAGPLLAVPAGAASAAVPSARVTLTRADLSNGTLTIGGTVTNTGSVPLGQVTADLWRSTALLRSVAAVQGALTATTTTPGTAAPVQDGNRAQVVADGGTMGPGESLAFTLTGTLDALGLTQDDATWWVGVDVTGGATGGRTQPLASGRTLVSRPAGTVPLASVVEFSAPPRQLKRDLFLDDDLAGDLATGRLAGLMAAAESGGLAWLLDPSLLVEVTDMADGYRVRADDGSTPGSGQAAAQQWLARLRALPTERGAAGLFGSPDLVATAHLGDTTVAEASVRASDAADAPGGTRVAVLDRPDQAALRAVQRWERPVVALDANAPGVRVVAGGTPVVVAVTSAPSFTPTAVLEDTGLNRDAARLATARAAGGEVRVLRSAADAAGNGPLPAGYRLSGLADVLALEPRPWQPPAETGPAASLDAATLERSAALRERMVTYADAAPDSGVGAFVDAQTARAASRWWADLPEGRDAWFSAIERRLSVPVGDLVSLDAAPRFSMTGATSEFPVTVTNHLADAVTVRVVPSSDNPQRIRLVAPEPATITPGASSTVILLAEAAGGGVVQATVHVETVGGHRLTPDREIAVETTNFGTIGWVLVVSSGVVLVVTTGMRIRQVSRKRKGEDG